MAKSKKETSKKPPVHEAIVQMLKTQLKSSKVFFTRGSVFHFLSIAPLIRLLLSMHIPETARQETATQVYRVLLGFMRSGVLESDIRSACGADPHGIRARIRSGR